MKLDKKGIDFLINEEGVKLSSYLDSAGVWTIGVGFTFYPDGTKVKQGQTITPEENEELLKLITAKFEKNINRVVTTRLTQNQFNALVSLSFNIGINAFNKSTLLKKINETPNDEKIKVLIEQWRFATVKGVKQPILLNRRKRESKLYFTYDQYKLF